MAEQLPSIGRFVHYVTSNGRHAPATVSSINDSGTLNLFVMDDQTGAGFQYNVVLTSDGSQPYSWHWPEYVPAKGELKF